MPNRLALVIIVLERWSLICFMAIMIINTPVLFWWRYLMYLGGKVILIMGQYHLIEYINTYCFYKSPVTEMNYTHLVLLVNPALSQSK